MEHSHSTPMTAEDFYQWGLRPENQGRHCELVRGRIVELPRTGKLHGVTCANVVGILGRYTFGRRQGYVCCNGTGIVLERNPDTVRGPDIMLFEEKTRLEDLKDWYVEKPPAVAVEVLTPDDRYSLIRERVKEQLRFGTPLVWVVDPNARVVTVHHPDGSDNNINEQEELRGADAPEGFACRVVEFFSLPGQQREMGAV